ncbi:hypothetical protein [Anaerotignum sp.]
MRMRTLDAVYQHIKENDPETCLTKTGLYYLVRRGEIPSIHCGKKRLIAIEAVEAYLAGEPLPQPEPEEVKPKLRCIG